MLFITLRRFGKRSGFTLVEAMTASFITFYILLACWSIYAMGWRWYYETAPRIDAQRAARLAVRYIIEGVPDTTVSGGTYSVGGVSYSRRNGISGAIAAPTISTDKTKIEFRLEGDSSNCRSFYLGTVSEGGDGVLCYKNSAGTVKQIGSTIGLTGLEFKKVGYGDSDTTVFDNLIRVTAAVNQTISGTRMSSYTIDVEFSEIICMRNFT